MHYPDGDNIITDNDGASWFTDGPPATTLKADVMNALVGELANILKAYNIPLKNSGNDTFDQIAGALIARDQGKTREASVVIASSDSDENARLTADVVISTNEDASVKINAQIVSISATGGGKILVRKGNYYCNNSILLQNNINLDGEGISTIIHNFAGSVIGIIDSNNAVGSSINNLYIYSDGNSNCIIGHNEENVAYNNISCSVSNSSVRHNFFYCNNLNGCIANNGVDGYIGCEYLSNCKSIGTIVRGANSGFRTCKYMSSCDANGAGIGIDGCINISSCFARNCSVGFLQCYHITTCKAYECRVYGYNQCYGVVDTWAWSCIAISVSTAFIASYRDCHGFVGNRSGKTSIYYVSCTPEWGSSANAAADTAAGGWNVTA
ncbi:MAG: hypothetical protein WC346_21410 [Methanogenium sp.]|jgi:hypothetical protein